MATKKIKDIEVKAPKVVKGKQFVMKANVGTNTDGSVRYPKGSTQTLTKKQEENYKKLNLI